MPAKKAAKKVATKTAPAAPAAPAKKAAKKAATKKVAAKKAAKPAKSVPTLEALQEAAYYNYLKRCETGAPGTSADDWAAAMKQLGA